MGFTVTVLRNNLLLHLQNIWIPVVTNYKSLVFIFCSKTVTFINIPLLILTQHLSEVKEYYISVNQEGKKRSRLIKLI